MSSTDAKGAGQTEAVRVCRFAGLRVCRFADCPGRSTLRAFQAAWGGHAVDKELAPTVRRATRSRQNGAPTFKLGWAVAVAGNLDPPA